MKVRTRHSFRMTRDARLPQRGFSLIELVITVAVLAILTLGVIPLVQVSVKRQKEEQLRAALREMREAFDQFRREALVGAQMQAMQGQGSTAQQEQAPRQPQAQTQTGLFSDPRVRVFITDQTIFGVDNPDRFPPDLETLVNGVDVLPITAGGLGRRGNMSFSATEAASQDSLIPKIKIYLRRIPVDPMTGKADWDLRSSYDSADANSWGGENVFDVRSKSEGTALNGQKYRDW
ncbi:MAG TPA: prepilin-type N-terminal cleavage/methylation domain-containing protein [Pyrinomonadaceae bacterium]